MIVLYPVILSVAVLVIWRMKRAALSAHAEVAGGWRWFVAWSVAGASMTFSFLTGLSIGLFILPLASAVLIWVAARAPRLGEALGFVEGIGVVLLLIAFVNRDYTPCAEHGRLYLPPGSPPGTSVSCGRFDPAPWLLAGLAVSGAALLGYAFIRRHDTSRHL